jgi:hypothetical protein
MALRRGLAIAAVAIIAVVVVASVGAYVVLGSAKKGTIQVYIKDAVGPWEHVNVTFDTVRVHRANSSDDSGWIDLSVKNGTLDLAHFVNVSALLGDGKVPVGKYTQLRIIVINATGVMTDGTQVNFTVPSGELKANHPFNIVEDGTTKLTVDIDLLGSIHQAGNKWIFNPMLGSVSEA